MNREQLKEHLWKLHCMLDELEDKDGQTSGKLGLLAKGLEVYDYLQQMELTDALEMYGRLDEIRHAQFIEAINNPQGESK